MDRTTLRLIKTEPRGFRSEWTTLYVPADRYGDAQNWLEAQQAHHNTSMTWRDYTPQEQAWRLSRLSDSELDEEIAYSLATIEDRLPVPLP